ncbi:MAG: Transcriptional regulator, MarR family, partial [uncultured Solirubrobacteraceae bacterium]
GAPDDSDGPGHGGLDPPEPAHDVPQGPHARDRGGVRALSAPDVGLAPPRARGPAADERAGRAAALRQLERHRDRGPPREPRPRRAPPRGSRPPRQAPRRHRGRRGGPCPGRRTHEPASAGLRAPHRPGAAPPRGTAAQAHRV